VIHEVSGGVGEDIVLKLLEADSVSVESYCDGSTEGGGEGGRFQDMLRLEDGHGAQVRDMRPVLIVVTAVRVLCAS
jgi:hypothetical protein